MSTQDWPMIKKKLKETVSQGMKLLKEGREEARYVAHQTAQFLQLEVDIYKLKSRIEAATYQLGKAIHQNLGKGDKIQLNPSLKKLSSELTTLKETLRKKEGQLRRTRLVRKE